jgi:hypothetical protein
MKEKVKNKEVRNENEEKWYGITSMGRHTEIVKVILSREGFNVFSKGGGK